MISPEQRKLLQDLDKTPYGKALKAFLEDELKEINSVENVNTLDEALGRKQAIKLVKKLFAFMGKPEPVDKSKVSYT